MEGGGLSLRWAAGATGKGPDSGSSGSGNTVEGEGEERPWGALV